MQVEDGDDAKGKGKGKQQNKKSEEKGHGSGNKPKAKSDSKPLTKPQCYKWVEDAGCPFGSNCQFTHAREDVLIVEPLTK